MSNLIGNISSPIVVNTAFTSPAPVAVSPEVLSSSIGSGSGSATFDPQAAVGQRLQTVQDAAQSMAASFVVSDHNFTIFKDSTGQYITRFTSLKDGSVTYIPEPNLLQLSGQSNRAVVTLLA